MLVLLFSQHILTIQIGLHVCAWNHVAKSTWILAIFHLDIALYWLAAVDITVARLNYVTSVIILTYFDHSNRIPCVSMLSFNKIHVEKVKFPHGFGMILVMHVTYTNGSPKLS
jgi:hypothetical protein